MLFSIVVAGLDPAIHGVGKPAWTTGIGKRSDAVLRTAICPVVTNGESAQNTPTTPSMIFSSASQVTTRSGRSTGYVATRRQAREFATSAASGRSLIGADHDMMLILDACAPNGVSANKCLGLTKMNGDGFPSDGVK
jgi:hypothetical protein